MLTVYVIVSVIILAALLFGVVFGLTALSKRGVHGLIIISTLLVGLMVLIVASYFWVYFAIELFNLPQNELWMKLIGLPQDYEPNIWFTLGSFPINYSIARAGLRTFSIIGGAVGAIRGLIALIQKLIARKKA